MITTRFCPTAHNGPLHLGHLINAYANLFWAKRHKGVFFLKPDYPARVDQYEIKQLEHFTGNLSILRTLFPRSGIVTTFEAGGWTYHLLKKKFGKGLSNLRNADLVISVGIDAIMGTTDIIRGHDWSPQLPTVQWESPLWTVPEKSLAFRAIFEQLTKRKPRLYYTPLLTLHDKKITKSTLVAERNSALNLNTLLRKFHPLALCGFACHVLGWNRKHETIYRFVEGLDMRRVQQIISVELDFAIIEAQQKWVSRTANPDGAYLDLVSI
jgi:hypothetical protein